MLLSPICLSDFLTLWQCLSKVKIMSFSSFCPGIPRDILGLSYNAEISSSKVLCLSALFVLGYHRISWDFLTLQRCLLTKSYVFQSFLYLGYHRDVCLQSPMSFSPFCPGIPQDILGLSYTADMSAYEVLCLSVLFVLGYHRIS